MRDWAGAILLMTGERVCLVNKPVVPRLSVPGASLLSCMVAGEEIGSSRMVPP